MSPRDQLNSRDKAEKWVVLIILLAIGLRSYLDNIKTSNDPVVASNVAFDDIVNGICIYSELNLLRLILSLLFYPVAPAPALHLPPDQDYRARLEAIQFPEEKIPAHLKDKHLLAHLMNDPVTLRVDGRIYDRESISRHIHSQEQSPFTRQSCTEEDLISLPDLRDEIRAFVEEQERIHRAQNGGAALEEVKVEPPEIKYSSNQERFNAITSDLPKKPFVDPIYCCSLTKEIMTDPVTASDGKHYERKALGAYLHSIPEGQPKHNREGVQLLPMDNLNYFKPNENLKNTINGFLKLLTTQSENRKKREESARQQQPARPNDVAAEEDEPLLQL